MRPLFALLVSCWLPVSAAEVLQLNLGDPDRRGNTLSVTSDLILDSATGAPLSPTELAQALEDIDVLLFGEEHTNVDFHDAQLTVIRSLHEAGRPVIVGLEMYPFVDQPILDDWVAGAFTEAEFVRRSNWYTRWGYHWNYYRQIFNYARSYGLPMAGLNAPREIISKFRTEGRANLSESEAAHLPDDIDTDSAEHLELFKAYFGSDDSVHGQLSDAQWHGMFSAQAAWDAVMGHNAVRAAQTNPDAIVVVLVGSGHVAYGLGIERQIAAGSSGIRVASVIPVPLGNDAETATVSAGYADFVWGLPASQAPRYPALGLSTMVRSQRLGVIALEDGAPAMAAGLEVGDVVVAINGVPITTRGELSEAMSRFGWGDVPAITVERAGKSLELPVPLRR